MSFEFVEALTKWLPREEADSLRKIVNKNSDERESDFARGQLDILEKLKRILVSPQREFGDLWPLPEEDRDEDEDDRPTA